MNLNVKLVSKQLSPDAVMESDERRKTKEGFIHDYMASDYNKLSALPFVIDVILKNGYVNIASFGSGACVLEYYLKMSLPYVNIVASDILDICLQAGEHFPEITVDKFDLINGDIAEFSKKHGVVFDMAIFFGATAPMDDEQLLRFVSDLKDRAHIKSIVEFNPKVVTLPYYVKCKLAEIDWIRKLLGKPAYREEFDGVHHGYIRSKRNLKGIFKKAGYVLRREFSLKGIYQHAAHFAAKTSITLSNCLYFGAGSTQAYAEETALGSRLSALKAAVFSMMVDSSYYLSAL